MSVRAKLIIDDQVINVIHYSFRFDQKSDFNGRPSQRPLFLGLEVTIETSKKFNLTEWAIADHISKQIELHLEPVIEGSRIRKIKLYDARLVSWNNNFSSVGHQPMSETLYITAAGVEDSNSSGVYSAYWRVTFPGKEGKPSTNKDTKKIKPTPKLG